MLKAVVAAGELKELVRQVDVNGLGDLHVPLIPQDHRDGDVRQITEDYGAVVCGFEVGIFLGHLVCFLDSGEVKCLGVWPRRR